MGEHICTGPKAEREAMIPQTLFVLAQLTTTQYHHLQKKLRSTSRTMPPSKQKSTAAYHPPSTSKPQVSVLHVLAADKSLTPDTDDPWTRQGQLTPNSLSGDIHLSPHQTDDFFISSPALEDDLIPSPRPIERPGAFGGFGERKHGPESDNLSVSPVNTSLLKRMDTIAPGPFDTTRSPSSPSFPNRSPSFDKPADFLSAPRDPMGPKRSATAPIQIPTTTRSTSHGSNYLPPPSPTIPSRNDYEGFGPPSADSDLKPKPLLISRSETFPKTSFQPQGAPPPRTPSAPGPRPDHSHSHSHSHSRSNGHNHSRSRSGSRSGSSSGSRPGSSKGHKSRPSMGPDTSRRPPPRTSLLQPQRKNSGSVDLAAEFGVKNPYHTPSDSTSSGYSGFSHPSNASSRTSPARSHTRRQPSDSSSKKIDAVPESLRPKDLRIDSSVRPPQRTLSPLEIAPTDRVDPAIQSARRFESPSTPYGTSPRDQHPDDPAVQSGRLRGTPSPQSRTPRKGSRDRTAYRGDCKACRQAITGKSISSADGRLTGKYHKACFVCTTCSEPFSSAEFYVLNDKPYCEQHYHKLNGSLCGSCQKGIEGQYLQDEFQIKYHVGCFRCLDCGQSLSGGYFEVEGRSYCERDAWRRVQQPWLANNNNDKPAESHPFMKPPGPSQSSRVPSSLAPPAPGRRPSHGMGGLPPRPAPSQRGPPPAGLGLRPPYGSSGANSRHGGGPGGPMPRMNKRSTRLLMM